MPQVIPRLSPFGRALIVERVAVTERIVWDRPFGRVISFDRAMRRAKPQPKVLMVAPMSGHYATLLRGTVEAFLPSHQVFITDWHDARTVPLAAGDLLVRLRLTPASVGTLVRRLLFLP